MGVPESELRARKSRVHHAKSKKSLTYAQIVQSGKANKTWSPDELKAIKLKTPDQYTKIGQSLAAARHSVEDQRHLQVRHRRALCRACSTASSRFRRCATARR